MKLTIRRQDLQQELALCQGIAEGKGTIPILSHILLRADSSGLELVATDLESGLRTRTKADVGVAGSAAVPGRVLHDIVRALGSDVVSLESEANNWLKVEGGSFKSRVVGLPESDFPTQPTFPDRSASVRVPLAVLQQMITRTVFAVTAENTRFSINGALLKITPRSLTLVATDGHRLAHVQRSLDTEGLTGDLSVLVPRKALLEINRMKAADENEEVVLATSGNHVFFRIGQRQLFSRTLEGTFPNYDKVIPHENPVTVRVPRRPFMDVINRVALLANDALQLVKFEFTKTGVTISTSGSSMSQGEAVESLESEHVGADVLIGLNHDYVQQFLSVLDDEQVEVKLKDSTSQALFLPAGDKAMTYQYVVMPMRLQ